MWPFYTIYFFGVLPMPAVGLVAAVFLIDVATSTQQALDL